MGSWITSKGWKVKDNHPLLYRREKDRLTWKARHVCDLSKNSLSMGARCKRSSCDFRHPPVCRDYKSGNRCINGYRCLRRQADGKRKLQRTLRRDTSEILRMHLVQNSIRESQMRSGGIIPKRWISWPEVFTRPVRRNNHWGNLTTSRLKHQSSVEFGEKLCKHKSNIKLRFILLWRRQRHRRSYVYFVFGNITARAEQEGIEFRYNGYCEKVQKNPYATHRDLGQCK